MTPTQRLYFTCTTEGNCREYIKGNLSKQYVKVNLDFEKIMAKKVKTNIPCINTTGEVFGYQTYKRRRRCLNP